VLVLIVREAAREDVASWLEIVRPDTHPV